MGKPLPAETVAEIVRMAQEGAARNEIARQLGVSTMAVTKYAPEGSFDRSSTLAAVKARQVDMAARRSQIALRLLEEIDRLLDDMRGDHLVFGWYGKDGDYHDKLLNEPPPGDKRALAGAVTSLMGTHVRLVDHDSDGGVAQAESVLDAFMDTVAQRAAEIRGE
jgi:hypothetical protein